MPISINIRLTKPLAQSKSMKILSLFLLCCAIALSASTANAQMVTYLVYSKPFSGPLVYKDTESGTLFYVESDGRHVVAINSDAKILWHRDPFSDAHLEPYRTDKPQIVFIGKPLQWMMEAMKGKGSGQFILINYNSTQAGVLDMKTGDFTFMGQD